jgi:hypothetical protein
MGFGMFVGLRPAWRRVRVPVRSFLLVLAPR